MDSLQYLYIGCAFAAGVLLVKLLNKNQSNSTIRKEDKKYLTV